MEDIPNEILVIIFEYINQGILGLVCWKWYHCIKCIQKKLHTKPGTLNLTQYEYFKHYIRFDANLMASVCKSGNMPLTVRLITLNCPNDSRSLSNLAYVGNIDSITFARLYDFRYDMHFIENAILGTNNLNFVQYLVGLGYTFDHKSIIAALRMKNLSIHGYLCSVKPSVVSNTKALVKYTCKTRFTYSNSSSKMRTSEAIPVFEYIADSNHFEDQFNVYKYIFKFNFVEMLKYEKIKNMIIYYANTQTIHENYYMSDEMIMWCKDNTTIDYLNMLLKEGYVNRIDRFIEKFANSNLQNSGKEMLVSSISLQEQVKEGLKLKRLCIFTISEILYNSYPRDIQNFILKYQCSIDEFFNATIKYNSPLLGFMIQHKLFPKSMNEILQLNKVDTIINLVSNGYILSNSDLTNAVKYYNLDDFKLLYSHYYRKENTYMTGLIKACVIQERLDIIEFILDNNRYAEILYLGNEMIKAAIRHNKLAFIQYGFKRGIRANKEMVDIATRYRQKNILLYLNNLIS